MRPRFNSILRTALLGSRWGMAPFCLGLIAALLIVLAQFLRELAQAVLEIFLPGAAAADEARPEWAGLIDFAGLKPKLFAAISAIAAIDLLETFINIGPADKSGVLWEIAMLLAFVVSGVLLAWMDRLAAERH